MEFKLKARNEMQSKIESKKNHYSTEQKWNDIKMSLKKNKMKWKWN